MAPVGAGVRGRLPGHRLGRRRRPRLPGPVGLAAPRSRRSRAPRPPTWRATASCGVGPLDCTIHSYWPLNVGSDVPTTASLADRWGCTPGATSISYAELVEMLGRHSRSRWPPWATSTTSITSTTRERGLNPSWTCLHRWYLWPGLPRPDRGPHGGAGRRPRLPPQPVGNAEAPAPGGDYRRGGYLHPAAWPTWSSGSR